MNPGEMRENKMGVEPVAGLLLRMAIPMMCSMMIQALYNIVDSMFVARINEAALTAVSMAFPLQNLMIAVATGTGVGVNALLSRSLGEKRQDVVDQTANMAVFLAALSALAFTLIGLFCSRIFMAAQTGHADIIEYGTVYVRIVTTLSFGLFGEICFEKLLQSTGRTLLSMATQMLGAVINLIFDPIFIFGLLGAPRLGVAGAALATVLGQVIGMLLGLALCIRRNPEVHMNFGRMLRPDGRIIRQIYAVGVPSILMASIGSVMTFCMNKILMGFTSTATAVFGIYFKMQSFFFMPTFGLNNGMVPIVAYNYGARKKQRILDTVHYAILYGYLILAVGFLFFELTPAAALRLFNASDEMLAIGVPALRIIATSYVFAPFVVISSSYFQALGNSIYSLIISASRQLLVLIPVAFLFSLTGKLGLVWLAYPIAEIMAVTMCVILRRRVLRTRLNWE